MVPDLSFTGLISHHSFSVTFSTPRPPPLLLFRSQKKLRVYVSNTWSVPPTTMVDLVLLQPRCSTSWPCRTFSTLLMLTFSFSRIRWSLQTWQTQSDSIRNRPHTNVSFADSVLCGDMEIKDYFSSCLADKTTSYLLVHWFWSSRWHMTFSGDHVCTPLGSWHTRFRWGVVKRSTLRPIPINGESFGRKTNSASFSCDKLEVEFLALPDRYSPGTNWKQSAKNKKNFWALRNGDSEKREDGSCILQSQEDQELSETAAEKRLITQKSSESQSEDLTLKQGHGESLLASLCEMFTTISHGCVHNTTLERQRIRTAIKFGGHSPD